MGFVRLHEKLDVTVVYNQCYDESLYMGFFHGTLSRFQSKKN